MKIPELLDSCLSHLNNLLSRERSKHPGMVIAENYIIIRDKYPKARLHGLVIARDPSLEGPADLRQDHLPLLQQMQVR